MDVNPGPPDPIRPTLKGAAYIADFLVQQKVPYIFGLCGHGILGLLDGLYDRRDEITTISVHHEAVAAFTDKVARSPATQASAPAFQQALVARVLSDWS